MRNLPHDAFEHNQTWLEISLIAQELLAWMKLICLDGELATAEPKRLRQRLLHVAGRLVRHGRRTRLRLQADWPWAPALAAAFAPPARPTSTNLSERPPGRHHRRPRRAAASLCRCPRPAQNRPAQRIRTAAKPPPTASRRPGQHVHLNTSRSRHHRRENGASRLGLCIAPFASVSPAASETLAADGGCRTNGVRPAGQQAFRHGAELHRESP